MNDYGMGDFYKKSLELQQNMAKNWMDAMTGAAANFGGSAKSEASAAGAPFTPFAAMNKMYESVYENWQKQFMDNPWMKLQPWSYNMFSTDNPMSDMFNKMMNSGKSLTDLSAIWQQLLARPPFASREEILKFIESNKASFEKLSQDFMSPFIPESLRPLVANAMSLIKQYEATGQDLLKPWSELAEKNSDTAQQIAQGDLSAYGTFYKSLNKAYAESFGKMFNAAGLGLTREQNEAVMAQFDTFFKMIISLSELMALIGNVSKSNMVEIIETYGKLVQEGKQPRSLKEFYELWIKTNEDAFVNVFGTPQFSKIFCEFAKKSCEYKIHLDRVLEQTLDWAPFPKNSEMANLYKTVYDLRKSDYRNTQRIEALEEALATLKAGGESAKTAKKGDK